MGLFLALPFTIGGLALLESRKSARNDFQNLSNSNKQLSSNNNSVKDKRASLQALHAA